MSDTKRRALFLSDKNVEILSKVNGELQKKQDSSFTGRLTLHIHFSQGTACKIIKTEEENIT
jgi:hypothetical protein